MTTLAQDTFQRANASSWGTASDGHVWATVAGSPTLAISSNEGTALTGAFATDAVMLLGSGTTKPINFLMRMKIINGNGGAVWRYQSSGNYYRLVCETGTAYLQKAVSGSVSTITTASGTFNVFVWLRVVSNNNDIAITLWADGSSEPGTPTISTTDSTYTTAGQYGISDVSYDGSSLNYFDSLTITDNSSGGSHTQSVQSRFRVAIAHTQSIGARLRQAVARTQSVPIRLRLAVSHTQSTPARLVLATLRTKPVGMRLRLAGSGRRATGARFVLGSSVVIPEMHVTWTTRNGAVTWQTRTGTVTWRTRL